MGGDRIEYDHLPHSQGLSIQKLAKSVTIYATSVFSKLNKEATLQIQQDFLLTLEQRYSETGRTAQPQTRCLSFLRTWRTKVTRCSFDTQTKINSNWGRRCCFLEACVQKCVTFLSHFVISNVNELWTSSTESPSNPAPTGRLRPHSFAERMDMKISFIEQCSLIHILFFYRGYKWNEVL